jgi:type II secretion system protein H
MPTSVRGICSRASRASRAPARFAASAFTLIEVLVVVAILALASAISFAVLDRDERGTVEREARRFAGALEYGARRAEMRHETLGVSADGAHWRFWIRAQDGRWRALSDDEPLAARALPSPLNASASSYAGRGLATDAIVPLRASGRNEPFAFVLAGEAFAATVTADPLNRVAIDGPRAIPR